VHGVCATLFVCMCMHVCAEVWACERMVFIAFSRFSCCFAVLTAARTCVACDLVSYTNLERAMIGTLLSPLLPELFRLNNGFLSSFLLLLVARLFCACAACFGCWSLWARASAKRLRCVLGRWHLVPNPNHIHEILKGWLQRVQKRQQQEASAFA
jgi:hypothetical protein